MADLWNCLVRFVDIVMEQSGDVERMSAVC